MVRTIEVIKAGGSMPSIKSVFLLTFGVALLIFACVCIFGRLQKLLKKSKRPIIPVKVEVGTGTTIASMDEWLQVHYSSSVHQMRNLVVLFVPFLLSLGFCYASDTLVTTSEVVGSTECSACAENDIKISHAVSGLRVTVECKVQKGHFKTRGVADLDEQGKFRVFLPDEIVKDGKLTEECFAQLHSSSLQPCPAAQGDLEALKIIVLSSERDGKTTFGLAKKIKFSPEICSSDFWFKYPPMTKFPPLPKYPWHKKPLPKLPNYKFPPLKKGFGHPIPPVHHEFKKPFLPPIPVPPIVKPHPLPKFVLPKKPILFHKKPLLPPLPKLPPFTVKPCPPFAKPYLPKFPPLPTLPPMFPDHPEFGKFPPLPPFHFPHYP